MDYSVTTPAGAISWLPWSTGIQWMNVSWGSQSVSIEITVHTGAPSYFIVTGATTIEAGNTTTLDIEVYDQKGNPKDRSSSGTLTWGAQNGAMDNATGVFTGDQIGTWNVWVDSDLGIYSEHSIEVTYGDISDVEVTAVGPSNTIIVTSSATLDSISMTSDDIVAFTVIRIDVQGNRETVNLPISGWTWLNGMVNAGSPTTWDAAEQGSSWVKASIEGVNVVIPMAVDHGIPVTIEARTTNTLLISGQDSATISAFTSDADGNEWSVSASWSMDTTGLPVGGESWLEDYGTTAVFEAVLVGDWTVNVLYVFSVPVIGEQSVYSDVTFTVMPGTLNSITTANDDTITADQTYDLTPDALDGHGNDLSEESLQWVVWDSTTELAPQTCSTTISGWTDITIAMRDANYVWEATTVGRYTICAFGSNNVQSMSTVNVTVGQVANVWHKAYSTFDESGELVVQTSTHITAGDYPFVEIWVADADGNQFQTDLISWSSTTSGFDEVQVIAANSNPLLEIGNYRFTGLTNQVYELSYSAGICGTCSGTWNVTVDYSSLFSLTAIASSSGGSGNILNVEQQAMVTIDVTGFDQFGNVVPISLSDIFIDEDLDSLNRGTILNDTSAEVYMLNEGMNTITICSGTVCDQVQISVDSTITGFFEANAPWSWIGLVIVATMLFGVFAVVVILMRRGDSDDEYDDDLFDDEEYDVPEAASDTESFSEPASQDDFSQEDDPNYRVDEDGTEWWQDDDGVWWYRDPNMDDWAEWTE